MQHETQNSKVAQHPVEFLQPLQLNSKIEVEFLPQQPFVKTLFLGQTYPETKRAKNYYSSSHMFFNFSRSNIMKDVI